jgi:hypothetical protein
VKEDAPKPLPVASSCCAPAASTAEAAQASASCCGTVASAGEGGLHGDVLARYDVNDYAASVKVFAVKPR